jgi:hypothetical protein
MPPHKMMMRIFAAPTAAEEEVESPTESISDHQIQANTSCNTQVCLSVVLSLNSQSAHFYEACESPAEIRSSWLPRILFCSNCILHAQANFQCDHIKQ